jgi:hypothetical protein
MTSLYHTHFEPSFERNFLFQHKYWRVRRIRKKQNGKSSKVIFYWGFLSQLYTFVKAFIKVQFIVFNFSLLFLYIN